MFESEVVHEISPLYLLILYREMHEISPGLWSCWCGILRCVQQMSLMTEQQAHRAGAVMGTLEAAQWYSDDQGYGNEGEREGTGAHVY